MQNASSKTTAAIAVDATSFQSEVLQSELPVLVDFWASWCGPCKMVAPIIHQLAEEYAGKIKVCTVDIDAQGELALQYGVMSIPTIMLFKNGNQVEQAVGANSKDFYEELIARHI